MSCCWRQQAPWQATSLLSTSVSATSPPATDLASGTFPQPAPLRTNSAEGPSLAERIGRLQQSIKNDQERLATLEAKVREQDEEFESASAEFQQRDEEFEKQQKLLKTAEQDSNATQVTALRETVGAKGSQTIACPRAF